MKDILKVMRFDYLTARPLAIVELVFSIVMLGSLSLFFSPIICSYLTLLSMVLVIPLQSTAEKSGFHKLYGILPVGRRSITRARFLYIYLVFFLMQLLELGIACLAWTLRLCRIFEGTGTGLAALVADSFSDRPLALQMIFGLFTVMCLLFSYMEMMGQIFGRENEFKIIMATIGAVCALAFLFAFLSEHDLIPPGLLPHLPETAAGTVVLGAVLDAAVLGLCLLFGEITASKMAAREL